MDLWVASATDIFADGNNWTADGWVDSLYTGGLLDMYATMTKRKRRLMKQAEEDEKIEAEAEAKALAEAKAATGADDAVVVAADTIVHRGDVTYGKPVDRAEAARFLRELRAASGAVPPATEQTSAQGLPGPEAASACDTVGANARVVMPSLAAAASPSTATGSR